MLFQRIRKVPGAPLPKASSVTPATLSDIAIFLERTCKDGQKLGQLHTLLL